MKVKAKRSCKLFLEKSILFHLSLTYDCFTYTFPQPYQDLLFFKPYSNSLVTLGYFLPMLKSMKE